MRAAEAAGAALRAGVEATRINRLSIVPRYAAYGAIEGAVGQSVQAATGEYSRREEIFRLAGDAEYNAALAAVENITLEAAGGAVLGGGIGALVWGGGKLVGEARKKRRTEEINTARKVINPDADTTPNRFQVDAETADAVAGMELAGVRVETPEDGGAAVVILDADAPPEARRFVEGAAVHYDKVQNDLLESGLQSRAWDGDEDAMEEIARRYDRRADALDALAKRSKGAQAEWLKTQAAGMRQGAEGWRDSKVERQLEKIDARQKSHQRRAGQIGVGARRGAKGCGGEAQDAWRRAQSEADAFRRHCRQAHH